MKSKEDMDTMMTEMERSDMSPEDKKKMRAKMTAKAKTLNIKLSNMDDPKSVEAKEKKAEETIVESAEKTKAENVKADTETETLEEVKTELSDTVTLQEKIKNLEVKLAEQNLQLREQSADAHYDTLLSEGKVIPAVENEIKALYLNTTTEINLADGAKKTVGEILDSLFKKMPKIINFEEQGKNLEATEGTSDISTATLEALRAMPIHKKKSDEEFEGFINKNKAVIMSAEQKYK